MSYQGVEPLGEAGNEVKGIGCPGGLLHIGHRRVGSAVADVVEDGAGEEQRLLAHQSNLRAENGSESCQPCLC